MEEWLEEGLETIHKKIAEDVGARSCSEMKKSGLEKNGLYVKGHRHPPVSGLKGKNEDYEKEEIGLKLNFIYIFLQVFLFI